MGQSTNTMHYVMSGRGGGGEGGGLYNAINYIIGFIMFI